MSPHQNLVKYINVEKFQISSFSTISQTTTFLTLQIITILIIVYFISRLIKSRLIQKVVRIFPNSTDLFISRNRLSNIILIKYQKSKRQIMNNNINASFRSGSKKKVSNGRWTKTEHQRFMKALQKFGRDWVSVQKFVKTRSLSQVRSHAQKVFLKMTDFDVQALIAYEGDSDYQNHQRSFYQDETAKSKDSQIKLRRRSNNRPEEKQKTPQKATQSLLDIFKRAIELETLELNQDSQSDQSLKQTLKISHNVSCQYLKPDQEKVFEQNSCEKTVRSNDNSRKLQNVESEAKFDNQESQMRICAQQMEFIMPDLKQFCQPMPTLTH